MAYNITITLKVTTIGNYDYKTNTTNKELKEVNKKKKKKFYP